MTREFHFSLCFNFDSKKDVVEYNLDPYFEKYIQRFINEGANRKVEIDFADASLFFEVS